MQLHGLLKVNRGDGFNFNTFYTFKMSGIKFSTIPSGAGGGSITGGDNGLSISTILPSKITLGQDVGQIGNPAALISDREIPSNGKNISFLDGSDNIPFVSFIPNFAGVGGAKILFDSVQPNADPASTNFLLRQESTQNTNLTFNNVVKFGFNPTGTSDPAIPGIYFAIEPNFVSGGNQFLESHLEVYLPGSASQRLFSATFINFGTFANSTNNLAWRCTTAEFRPLDPLLVNQVIDMSFVAQTTLSIVDSAGNEALLRMFGLNDTTFGLLYHRNDEFDFSGKIRAFSSSGINIAMQSNASAGISFETGIGQRIFTSLAGGHPFGDGNFIFYDTGANFINLAFTPNQRAIFGLAGAAISDTGANLQVVNGGFSTEQPSASGNAIWRLGTNIVTGGANVLDVNNYLEISVNGVVKKLALIL